MQRSTVDALLRTTQAYALQLCEKETLAFGIAYYSAHLANFPEANQFREVVVDDSARWPEAYQEAEAWFQSQSLVCHRWAPVHGHADDQMVAFLQEYGFTPRTYRAMTLARWVTLDVPNDIRIVPARAIRAPFHQLLMQVPSPEADADPALAAQATEERLNDPQFDMVVALRGLEPIGRCALYQVGDIARVMELTTGPDVDPDPIARALLDHVLTLAKRLAMRFICAQVDERHKSMIDLFTRAGFGADGTITEFVRPLASDVDARS